MYKKLLIRLDFFVIDDVFIIWKGEDFSCDLIDLSDNTLGLLLTLDQCSKRQIYFLDVFITVANSAFNLQV